MSQLTKFEGRSPEELQAKVRSKLGAEIEDLTVIRHGRERYGGVLGFFQSERWLLEVEVPDSLSVKAGRGAAKRRAAIPSPRRDPLPAAGTLSHLLDSTEDMINVDFGQTFAHVLADAEATVAAPSVHSSGRYPVLSPPPQAYALNDRHLGDERHLREPELNQDLLARARLIAAGLADHLLPESGDPRPEMALLHSLLRLPAAPRPPTDPGDVLLLAGPLAAAVPLGQQLAQRSEPTDDLGRVGELTGELIVVTDRALPDTVAESSRARTPDEAGTVVFRRRAKAKTTVVVLDTAERASFVRAVVSGVRPEAMWGVVPAAWSLERTEKLEELTGDFDAIALEGFLDTDRPAQLIGRHWPVAFIDGWAASPLSVAARLIEAVTGLADAHGA